MNMNNSSNNNNNNNINNDDMNNGNNGNHIQRTYHPTINYSSNSICSSSMIITSSWNDSNNGCNSSSGSSSSSINHNSNLEHGSNRDPGSVYGSSSKSSSIDRDTNDGTSGNNNTCTANANKNESKSSSVDSATGHSANNISNKKQKVAIFADSDALSSVHINSNLRNNTQPSQHPHPTQHHPVQSRPHPRIASAENEPEIFLKQYFAQSRLHFIGSWRNRLPTMVNRLLKKKKIACQLLDIERERESSKGIESTKGGGEIIQYAEDSRAGSLDLDSIRKKSCPFNVDEAKKNLENNKSEMKLSYGTESQEEEEEEAREDGDNDIYAFSGNNSNIGIINYNSKNGSSNCKNSKSKSNDNDNILSSSSDGNHKITSIASHSRTYNNTEPTTRIVIHLDMDCFFVSAVLRSEAMRYLRDQPVAVAHSADTPYIVSSISSNVSSSTTNTTSAFLSSLSPPRPSFSSSSSIVTTIASPTSSSSSVIPHSILSSPSSTTSPSLPSPPPPPASSSSSSSSSSFSSSSEISSCNYPARASGNFHFISVFAHLSVTSLYCQLQSLTF